MKTRYLLILSLLFLVERTASAQFNVIHNFYDTLGEYPEGGLTLSGKVFYGMANGGGTYHDGCVFSVDTNGNNYKVLVSFHNDTMPYGRYPAGSLTLIGNKLFGMTYNGGTKGDGVIFSVDTNGTEYKEIYDLSFADRSGVFPYGNLLYAGNLLYGMTSSSGLYDRGDIFSIDTSGNTFTDLHDFDSVAKGLYGLGSLTISGNMLYGMLPNGGTSDSGVIFSMDTLGNNYKVIHDFGGAGGGDPEGSLTLSGNILYGMTYDGGKYGNGNIFSIDTLGNNFTDMHDFNDTAGANPFGDLLLEGNVLYGMTYNGGLQYDSGCAFSIHTDGSNYTVINYFNISEGANPRGDLIISGSILYGMTVNGGLNGDGVIFGLDTSGAATSIKLLTATQGSITVYPNPSNGMFTINMKNADGTTIEIYNVLGETVYKSELTGNTTQINLGDETPGIYLCRILKQGGNVVGVGKISIE